MSYHKDLETLMSANKARYATHLLVGLLRSLCLKSAISMDVGKLIDEHFSRRYVAKLEIFEEGQP